MPEANAEDAVARLCAGVGREGWACSTEILPASLVHALASEAVAASAIGALRPATIGRGTTQTQAPAIRGDAILWLDRAPGSAALTEFLARMEQLRLAMNRTLWLGLFEFEAHFAYYPPGTAYARHRDQHRGVDARQLTVSVYLNTDWSATDGGALRLHTGPETHVDFAPAAGTLIAFLSERYEHEVLPARRARYSITGWFRRRQ